MQQIWTVSELTSAIKNQLESRFPQVSVRGEISNLKEQASGHLYFTLKDAESQISVVLFKGTARLLNRLPKGGDQVILQGELSVYAPRGNYQLIVRTLEYQGVGPLLLKLHELKKKLEERGWFAANLKKKLPKYPRTIGIVTSPTGAVIQDILHVLNRRFSGVHLILNPVKVQGEGAAQEIAQAIRQFNQYRLADVLIVGRGGGSLEDLFAFNEEVVAEAIFASEIPIISAVGHETDVSIADFVADVRAPTPSAAAEMAVAEKAQQLRFLSQAHDRLTYAVRALASQHRKALERVKRAPLLTSAETLLGSYVQRLDEMRADMQKEMGQHFEKKKLQLFALSRQASLLNPSLKILSWKQKFASLAKALQTAGKQRIVTEKGERLKQLVAHLKAIDPKNVLTRGYCILFQENTDSVILSSKELAAMHSVRIVLHDGEAQALIREVQS